VNNTLFNNTVNTNGTGSTNRGIFFNSGASNNTVANNTVTTQGNGGFNDGIRLSNNSHGNRILQNIIQTNGDGSDHIGISLTSGADGNSFINNHINTTGDDGNNDGISLVTVFNNTFISNIINTNGSDSFSIDIATSSNNTFNNTVLSSPNIWMDSDGSSVNNFSNITFETINGSIRLLDTFTINSGVTIGYDQVNISQNRAFLNSTNLTFLNVSAQITLNNITLNNPIEEVDFDDDGVFEVCKEPQCISVSFTSDVFVFNVSSFTTYQASEGSVCGDVSSSITVNQSLLSNGTCFTINADDLQLDCAGFSIRYNANGGDDEYGISVTSIKNITIKNCRIQDVNNSGENSAGIFWDTVNDSLSQNNTIHSNGSGTNRGINLPGNSFNNIIQNNTIFTEGSGAGNIGIILISGSNNNTIRNNTISTQGTTGNYGILIQTAHNNSLLNNTANISGSSNGNFGIFFSFGASHNIASGNKVRTNGTNSNSGIRIQTAINNTVENNTIHAQGSSTSNFGIYLVNTADNNTIKGNKISTNGTSGNEGIRVQTSNNNIIKSNIIDTNGSSGQNYGIHYSSNSNNNTFTENIIHTESGPDSFGIRLGDGEDNIFINNNLSSPSEWIRSESTTLSNFTNTTFKTVNGSIRILDQFQINGIININFSVLNISQNRAFLNSTNLTILNVSAEITLFNITFADAQPEKDINDNTSFLFCPQPDCTEISFLNGAFVFNVSSFTTYRAGPDADPNITNVTLFDLGITEQKVNFTTTEPTNYTISFSRNCIDFGGINISGGNFNTTTSVSISPLVPDTQYCFQINVTDPSGNTNASRIFNFTTRDGTPSSTGGSGSVSKIITPTFISQNISRLLELNISEQRSFFNQPVSYEISLNYSSKIIDKNVTITTFINDSTNNNIKLITLNLSETKGRQRFTESFALPDSCLTTNWTITTYYSKQDILLGTATKSFDPGELTLKNKIQCKIKELYERTIKKLIEVGFIKIDR